MSDVRPSTAPRDMPLRLRFDEPAVAACLCFAVLLVALPWQVRWGSIPDTSWIITVSERLLAGDRLYTDIVETNPPFSVWLYLPPVALAEWLGLLPELAVLAYVSVLCLGGFGFAAYVSRAARLPESRTLIAVSPALLALLVVFPGNAFSQREHIGVALLLPLLVLIAWRASPECTHRPPVMVAVTAGLMGAVIVLAKPYYAVMIIAPALWAAWRRRSLAPLIAPEHWAGAMLCAAYLAVVLAIYPEYLRDVYPLLADTYMQVRAVPSALFSYGVIAAAWFLAMGRMLRARRTGTLAIVLSIASVAAWLPFLYQGKAWPYQAYPAIALGAAALLCSMAAGAGNGNVSGRLLGLPFLILAAFPFMQTQRPDDDLVAAIRNAADQPSMALVGSDIAAGHPMTRMVDGHWAGAYCSDWLGTMALYLWQHAQAAGNAEAASYYRLLTEGYVGQKLRALGENPPDVLLVQKSDGYWLSHLGGYDAYRRIMADYRLLAEDETISVYTRAVDAQPPGAPPA